MRLVAYKEHLGGFNDAILCVVRGQRRVFSVVYFMSTGAV